MHLSESWKTTIVPVLPDTSACTQSEHADQLLIYLFALKCVHFRMGNGSEQSVSQLTFGVSAET